MQLTRRIGENETLANSLSPMNDNWESLLSSNSGISFPVSNLQQGMLCFRTDELALYTLSDVKNTVWVKIAQLTLTYVDKEYVDSMHIDISRVDNLIDNLTGKVKMSLMYTGTENGQLVKVGENNKIATSLIDTGTDPQQLVQVGDTGKIATGLIDVGMRAGQIPILDDTGHLVKNVLPTTEAFFDGTGKLIFPNGNKLWVS